MNTPEWQTCPRCGERWWDSHVCRSTLNSLNFAPAATCRFCGQAARTHPAQEVPQLTDEEIEAIALQDKFWTYMDMDAPVMLWSEFARAIEAAVLAKIGANP